MYDSEVNIPLSRIVSQKDESGTSKTNLVQIEVAHKKFSNEDIKSSALRFMNYSFKGTKFGFCNAIAHILVMQALLESFTFKIRAFFLVTCIY